MKFVCDSCRSRYEIADEKVAGKTLQIRCRNCGHLIRLSAPAMAAAADAATASGSESTVVTWHYAVNGEVFGPYTEDELVDRFQDGRLGDEAHVWQAHFAEWKPANEVPVFSSAIAVGRRTQVRQRAPRTVQLEASDLANLMAAAQPAPSREPLPARRATVAHAPIAQTATPLAETARQEPVPMATPAAIADPVALQPAATPETVAGAESLAADSPAKPLRRRSSVAMPVAFDELRERIASGNRPATETPAGVSAATALEEPAPAETIRPSTPVAEASRDISAQATVVVDAAPAEPAAALRQAVDDLPTGELPAIEVRPAAPAAPAASAELDELDELLSAPVAPASTRPRTASASLPVVPPPKPMGTRAPTGSPPAVPASVAAPARSPALTPAQQPDAAPAGSDLVTPAPVAHVTPAPAAHVAPAPATEAAATLAATDVAPQPVATPPDVDHPPVAAALSATATQTPAPTTVPVQTPSHTAEQQPAINADQTSALASPAAPAQQTPANKPATPKSTGVKTDDDSLVDSWLGQGGGPPTVTSASYAVATVPLVAVQPKKTSPLVWASAFIVVAALVGAGAMLLAPDTTISTPNPSAVAVADNTVAADVAVEEASAVAEASAMPVGPPPPSTTELLVKVRAQRAVGAAVSTAHTAALSSAGLPAEAIAELQRRQQIERNTRPTGSRTNDRDTAAGTQDTANSGTGQSAGSSFANMRNSQQVAINGGQATQRNDGPGREHFAAGLSGFVANAFRRCVQRHLVDEGSLPNASRVVVEITVQPDGDVSGIRLDNVLRGTTFGDCMEGNSQNWRFPPFDGAATTLQRTYIIE